MVGGIVIGLSRGNESTLVHVQGTGSESKQTLSVRCIERRINGGDSVSIGINDKIWWQCERVMWTPLEREGMKKAVCGVDFDIQLPKIGYSH